MRIFLDIYAAEFHVSIANATVFAYANVVKLRRRGGLTLERNLRTLFTAPFSFLRIDGRKKLSNGITNTAFTITFRTFNVISLTYF